MIETFEEYEARIEKRAKEIRDESTVFANEMVKHLAGEETSEKDAIITALFHWHSREIASCQIALEDLAQRTAH